MVNIRDVANRAGVSMMTVSRVMNNNGAVSAATRRKVEEAIKELDYIPNQLAQGLVSSSSRTVGVLFSNIFNPVYSSIISGIEAKAHESGYNIIISNATDYHSSVQALNMLVSKMVDGLIILPVEPDGLNDGFSSKQALGEMWQFYEDLKALLAKRKIPCVVIDIDINTDLVEYVCHDYASAARIGIRYLIDEGFRKIYQINSELKSGLWSERQQMYEEEMRAANLADQIRIEYCANSTQESFNLVKGLLERGDVPEVFYCANDILAIGAMQAINSCSLAVPNDVSVMGNDGIYVGEMIIPALTTVDINSVQVGSSAMETCHNLIEGQTVEHKKMIEARLLCRKSVKKRG